MIEHRVAWRSSTGLSSEEAAARLARDGLNILAKRPSVPLWRRVAAQLRDPLIVVLLVAAALTLATGDWTDMTVIVLVIAVNTTVGGGPGDPCRPCDQCAVRPYRAVRTGVP